MSPLLHASLSEQGRSIGDRHPQSPAPSLVCSRPQFLLVENDLPFARALATILRRWGESYIASTYEEGCQALLKRPWSALFADVKLEPGSGFDILSAFRATHRVAPAMVLTGFMLEGADSRKACALKAHYVEKPISSTEIAAFLEFLERPRPCKSLSAREGDVVRRLLRGEHVKAIACDTGVADGTVRNFIRRAKQKLGANSRRELLEFAARDGLLVGPLPA